MTSTLSRLESKGFIRTEPDPKDGRSKRVYLTEAGKTAREDGVAAAAPLFRDVTGALDRAQAEALLQPLQALRRWLDENRTDSVDFEPVWIGNFLATLVTMGAIWAGFLIAKRIDPSRDYFDQFPLYVGYSLLVLYLGIAGWRHAETRFPQALGPEPEPEPSAPAPLRDWTAQGKAWIARIEAEELWRDPALTLASLARLLGTNTTYLSRALGAASGENFNAVINRRRVAAVQERLAVPGENRDLLSLALDAGFNSKASFNRAFRDFAGMSPSAWRSRSQISRAI